MRNLLLLAGMLIVPGIESGCAHVDRARAEYHEDKAERAAAHGRYRKAAREEEKARAAREDARYDPLP